MSIFQKFWELTPSQPCDTIGNMRLLALLLALPPWNEPTAADSLAGLATVYAPGVMEAVADYRGYDGSFEPVALMACGDLGRIIWANVDSAWYGPMVVVDCARRDHYEARIAEGKVMEMSWKLWKELGLPLRPYPIVVSFENPWKEIVSGFPLQPR